MPAEPAQLDLLSWEPEPAPAEPEPPPLDDIAEAWTDLAGTPYPGREAVLAELAAWQEARA